jgi:glycosyltransferase involved in cell wall biosynthesis
MHILFLTDNFPPEVNAPASRTFEHCKEWVRSGHDVTIVTCVPNFPKGRVFKGFQNRIWQTQYIDGIHVVRVWTYITANEGFFKRIFDYLSFMISSFLASFFIPKVDLIIGTSPQFFTVFSAYMVSLFKRVPWVFELRDIWPESIRAVGAIKSSRILDHFERLELFLYDKASAIVSVTHAFKTNLINRGVDELKIHVVTNGVDMGRYSHRRKDKELVEKYNLQNKFVAGYIGTHGMAHALNTILDAARTLRNSKNGDSFKFILLGDGANKNQLQDRAKQEGLSNVIFIDTVPKNDVVRYWSILDVSIIHLKKTELFKTVIPSKLFECMGMGIPILHGVQGESAKIVEAEEVGVLFEPENEHDLISGLHCLAEDKELHQKIKSNCLETAINYNRSKLALEMLQVLIKCIKGNRMVQVSVAREKLSNHRTSN